MKTASIRQVRHDFSRVLDWVADGEPVEVTKRGKVVAVIQPPARKKNVKARWPGFEARLHDIYGSRSLTAGEAAASLTASRGER
jgi:prevent-host-death family protein